VSLKCPLASKAAEPSLLFDWPCWPEIFKQGDLIIKFIDFKLSENRILRKIDNKEFYFENTTCHSVSFKGF
jgi:hypothetical protein